MPKPFAAKQFTFAQPDGTTFKARGWGDQHSAVFEEEGFTIVRDPVSGYYHYAKLSADGADLEPSGIIVGMADPAQLGLVLGIRVNRAAVRGEVMASLARGGRRRRCEERRNEQRNRVLTARSTIRGAPSFAPPDDRSVGDYVGICILINFPDVPAQITQQEVDNFCNEVGYDGFGNNGSVYDYFLDVSNGRLRYTNLITEYYTSKHPRAYYTNEAISDGKRARELIGEALDHLEAKGFDFSPLTADNTGYIRALNIFYAGPVVNNWSKGLWPHSWHLATEYPVGGGKKFFDYQFTAMGDELELGTFCHENGHMICDFPDLYDYGYESNGIGNYCLMCGGGHDEKNPVRVGAYLMRAAGWAHTVTAATPGSRLDLDVARDDLIIQRKSADEYFLIENRHQLGRDVTLPDSGLAIWHIDESGSNNHEQGTAALHYECELEQADGKRELENNLNQGGLGDLFTSSGKERFGDQTTPNSRWWNGTPSGLEIVCLSGPGPKISVEIPGSGEGEEKLEGSSKPNLEVPDDSAAGVQDAITLDADGKVASILLGVDISHTYRGDLVVSLVAPSGATAVVHNRQGGNANDLKAQWDSTSEPALQALLDEDIRGEWTLHIQDLAGVDTGRLNEWTLGVTAMAYTTVRLEESPKTRIPDNDPNGIERTLTTDVSGTVANLRVEVDITHTYIRDLQVTLTSPNGRTVALHDRSGESADNIIRTFTLETTPDLSSLSGASMAGAWQLHVSDHEGQDVGKLNRWALELVPSA